MLAGSLYHHFDSKESMVDEMLSSFLAGLRTAQDAVLDTGLRPRETLRALVTETFRHIGRNRAAAAIYRAEAAHLATRPGFRYLADAGHAFEQALHSTLERGVADGAFLAGPDTRLTSRFVRDAVWGAATWHEPGGSVSRAGGTSPVGAVSRAGGTSPAGAVSRAGATNRPGATSPVGGTIPRSSPVSTSRSSWTASLRAPDLGPDGAAPGRPGRSRGTRSAQPRAPGPAAARTRAGCVPLRQSGDSALPRTSVLPCRTALSEVRGPPAPETRGPWGERSAKHPGTIPEPAVNTPRGRTGQLILRRAGAE